MDVVANSFFAKPDGDAIVAFENRADIGELPPYRFSMVGYGSAGGVVGCGGAAMTRLLGPYSTFAGVHGTAQDFSGVAGTSLNRVGVYGQVEDGLPAVDGLRAGVLGMALNQPAVIGFSLNNDAIQGQAFTGYGVSGVSASLSGVRGVCFVPGPPVGMNIPTTAGVLGTSLGQPGVIGTSEALMGVYGFSTNNAGVVGETASSQSFAGYFAGRVRITGNLEVAGQIFAGVKDAIVPFPDGSNRVLHCMESPEHWFEDFGAARLKRGCAVAKLDADFAKVIRRGDYHVFLTPRGDCRGLYVRSQGGSSFEVRELGGGKSSVAFSYRIVGHRKDIKRHKRFAKIDTRAPLLPAARARRRSPTLRAFIAEVEKRARERTTPAMRESDRKVAAMPAPDLEPRRGRASSG